MTKDLKEFLIIGRGLILLEILLQETSKTQLVQNQTQIHLDNLFFVSLVTQFLWSKKKMLEMKLVLHWWCQKQVTPHYLFVATWQCCCCCCCSQRKCNLLMANMKLLFLIDILLRTVHKRWR